ncbi:hypothetical protein [Bacillus sp. FJAT-27445]|uniref:hypothetical protein n=1 Tax=Bacillus sp. FJAT-27445 TaxID=1679166 RepID=UPI000AFE3A6A|nr:hypothetical protein [Bacillus sp. FJAT-27445]
MMNSETYIDFCFARKEAGSFSQEVDSLLKELFSGKRLNWYLEEKMVDGADVVIAEIKGMSPFQTEEETIHYIETKASEAFWEYLQGYKIFVYPNKRGCGSCGTH